MPRLPLPVLRQRTDARKKIPPQGLLGRDSRISDADDFPRRLFWDTQQGSRFMILALDKQRQVMQRTNWGLWLVAVVTDLNLICAVLNLVR